MPGKALPYGARITLYDDGVILVKQTRMSAKVGRHVLDIDASGDQKERFVNPGDDLALAEAVRLAGQGKLTRHK